MSKAMLAAAIVAVSIPIGGCDRADSPEKPSPGHVPRPTVALPAAIPVADTDSEAPARPSGTPLFSAPGSLPAAERHFELFQRMNEGSAPLVKASLPPATSRSRARL